MSTPPLCSAGPGRGQRETVLQAPERRPRALSQVLSMVARCFRVVRARHGGGDGGGRGAARAPRGAGAGAGARGPGSGPGRLRERAAGPPGASWPSAALRGKGQVRLGPLRAGRWGVALKPDYSKLVKVGAVRRLSSLQGYAGD